MAWLKRNLALALGGLVALGLLGLGVFFLLAKIQRNEEVRQDLEQRINRLRTLVSRKPHPNEENIAAAKKDEERARKFVEEIRQEFLAPEISQSITNKDFRLELDRTINDLRRRAEWVGVEIPKGYWFTFDAQRSAVEFPNLMSLARMLTEVKALANVVFDAKVNGLVAIKRAPTADEDTTISMQTYVDADPITNEWAISTPYELTFRSFSGELASVLDGLTQSKVCFVVKNVAAGPAPPSSISADPNVDPNMLSRYGGAPSPQASPATANPYGGGAGAARAAQEMRSRYGTERGMNPSMRSRYGLGSSRAPNPLSRYGGDRDVDPRFQPGGGSYGPPPMGGYGVGMGQPGQNDPFKEKLLEFTLSIEVITVKPPGASSDAAPAPIPGAFDPYPPAAPY